MRRGTDRSRPARRGGAASRRRRAGRPVPACGHGRTLERMFATLLALGEPEHVTTGGLTT
ncbi:MAG TPA: hypothetical protein VIC57_17370 [Candidatus Dormibacteraeota bacterium]